MVAAHRRPPGPARPRVSAQPVTPTPGLLSGSGSRSAPPGATSTTPCPCSLRWPKTSTRSAIESGRWPGVLLDGTLVPIDRVAGQRRFYSGRHRRHGMNVQVLADPFGRLMWAAPPLPGSTHDLTAARRTGVIEAAPARTSRRGRTRPTKAPGARSGPPQQRAVTDRQASVTAQPRHRSQPLPSKTPVHSPTAHRCDQCAHCDRSPQTPPTQTPSPLPRAAPRRPARSQSDPPGSADRAGPPRELQRLEPRRRLHLGPPRPRRPRIRDCRIQDGRRRPVRDLDTQRGRGRCPGLLGVGQRAIPVGAALLGTGLDLGLADEILSRPGIRVIERPSLHHGPLLSLISTTPRPVGPVEPHPHLSRVRGEQDLLDVVVVLDRPRPTRHLQRGT
ncbi:hypothetical protein DMP14_31210, partial [Pseudonocardia sp. Ae707_Ps2]